MGVEVEIKYVVADFEPFRGRLQEGQATVQGIVFEENIVYDTDPGTLLAGDRLLRLRTMRGRTQVTCLLTQKMPARKDAAFKIREEYETVVEDGEALDRILQNLGYIVAGRYEKVRETWSFHGTTCCFDTLPFGCVLEIEGREEDICFVESFLHLSGEKKSTQSYHELYADWKKEQGMVEETLGFVFEEQEREFWLRYIQLTSCM